MKKILVVCLILCLMLTFSSCDGGKVNTTSENIFPSKAITIICPYGAGGGTDALSRKVAELSESEFGEEVVVVNKTGGAGAVGMGEGSIADADGYTITMTTVECVLLPLAELAPFSPSDFEPLIRINFDPASIVVRADSSYQTIDDLVKAAEENPGEINVMTSSFPTNFWLCTTMVEEEYGIQFNKVTAQAGAADQIQNLLGDHVEAITITPAEAAPYVESGDLKILAIASSERLDNFSDVPVFNELGYNIEVGTWRGLMVPKGTPSEVVEKLEEVFTTVYETKEMKQFLSDTGFGEGYLNSEDFSSLIQNQTDTYKSVVEKYK